MCKAKGAIFTKYAVNGGEQLFIFCGLTLPLGELSKTFDRRYLLCFESENFQS